MVRLAKLFIFFVLMSAIFPAVSRAQTINAASCSSSDVQKAINSAAGGSTVLIPPGTCTWTGGVSLSGVKVAGAGAGRVIAVDAETIAETIGTGIKIWSNVIGDTSISGCPSCTTAAPNIAAGETLRIMEDGWDGNFMQGTVSSFSAGVLTMNITSAGGICGQADTNGMSSNCKRWLITTLPSTVICNNLSSGAAFNITESTAIDSSVGGIFFGMEKDPRCSGVTSAGGFVNMSWVSGGVPILVHDNFIERQNAGTSETVDSNTNRGVVWNNSFVASPFSATQIAAIRIKDAGGTSIAVSSWTSVADWGSADASGNQALYFESNDLHAYNNGATDDDDGGRMVVRYNFIDNTGLGSHGADTSWYGMRTMELYDNLAWFQAYSDVTTANVNWWFNQRGGSSVIYNNDFPKISSSDWGTKPDISLDAYQLQRAAGPDGCWGAGGTAGQYYPAPRQTGFGYVTGAGSAHYVSISGNPTINVNGADDPMTYVGDSEPVYIWNNSRTLTIGIANGAGAPCVSPDTATNYIKSGRDYFQGTAKPSYTPAPYPNPYTGGQFAGGGNAPAAPTSLTATVQ